MPVANTPSTLTPDFIIEVGPPPFTRFPAHSTVLSTQSGFFRAAITRANEMGKLSENCIYLPNITVDHFMPLLTYMYTGFLELNYENIFGVLLATHLLHMPRALEICRDFLARSQRQTDYYTSAVPLLVPSTSSSSRIIRPIPSKASSSGLNFVSPPKAMSNVLVTSHETPFKSLGISPSEEVPSKIQKLTAPENLLNDQSTSSEPPKKTTPSSKSTIISRKISVSENLNMMSSVSECDKVIIDIASCDGPVRFRRVLNEAFELNKKSLTPSDEISSDAKLKYHQSNVLSFHQQMAKNINEQYKQNSFATQNSEESENSQHSGELYTCIYCNHTFKSKYCYQKHAKRHINPLNPMGKSRDGYESSDGEVKKNVQIVSTNLSVKRDTIKPLDMNVQYYPCKTCGCKFPSYYFVHKHRKLCHPEIAADGSIQPISEHGDMEKSCDGEKDLQEI